MSGENTTPSSPQHHQIAIDSELTTTTSIEQYLLKSLPPPKERFALELEFINALASPAYLHHLATQSYFSDPQFLKFLKYLQYWKQPQYVKYITYPHCLFFLDLILTNEAFRREMSFVQFRNFVHEQQFYAWMYRSRFLYGRGIHGPDVDPSDSAVQNGDHQDNPSDDVDMDTS